MAAPGDPGQHRIEVEQALRARGVGDQSLGYLTDAWSSIASGPELGMDKFGAIKSGADPYVYAAQVSAKQREQLLAKQKAEEEGLFSNYENKLAGQEKLTDAYGRLKTEAGIPDLQKQVDVYKTEIYKVKDLLDRLDEDITSRTRGTFTSEAQRNRQVAAEGDPLRTSLSRLGTAATPYMERLSSAMSEVGTMLGLTKDEQTKELEPIKMRINATTDRFAREITGFNQSKTDELNGLLDQITRGRELEDREWERIQTLAAEERAWAKTKEEMALQFEYDMKSAKASGSGSDALASILSKYANGSTTTESTSASSIDNDIVGAGSSGGGFLSSFIDRGRVTGKDQGRVVGGWLGRLLGRGSSRSGGGSW
jgi:hypothetical protein